MFTPKRVSRIGSRLSLGSPRASPAASGGKTTVPVQISELLKSRAFDDLDGNVLNCGFACIATNDTIFCWKVSQRSQVYQLPVPAGCHAKVKKVSIIIDKRFQIRNSLKNYDFTYFFTRKEIPKSF